MRRLVVAMAVITAATRFLAISRAPWEWDEILFASGVREYDVAVHHPHPPGSPLFIAAAKLFSIAGFSDFHALQVVVVAGAMLLFPLVFLLGRELGLGDGVAAGGALVAAFAPNVWYYGGTAFSDVPALALILGASLLLLRGRRDERAWIAGAALLGVAAGFRPQLVLIGALPLILAAWANRRRLVPGLALLVAIPIASYAGAAIASSSAAAYADAVREQQAYVARVDSFRSPTRPSLASLTRTFFKPTRGGGVVDKIIPLLAAAGVVLALFRRRAGALLLLAMFGPLAVFSWLMLDLNAASRYTVAYVPMFGLLAALAIDGLVRGREWLTVTVCGAIALWFAFLAWQPLQRVRTEDPPLLQAIRSIEPDRVVYAVPGVLPFAAYYREGRGVVDLSDRPAEGNGDLLLDALSSSPCARNFIRERGRLADIARARYFEASAVPVACP
ncbi:MAG TPA: glycosyltransferase family 39 protein [Thermoanaerobaculia bacterium]|nr:glycosyltransferase family 39 protein [Thermoanaerobaculia bacterium]